MDQKTRDAVNRYLVMSEHGAKTTSLEIERLEADLMRAKHQQATHIQDAQTFRDLLRDADAAESASRELQAEMPPSMAAYIRDPEPFTEDEVNRIVCGLTL